MSNAMLLARRAAIVALPLLVATACDGRGGDAPDTLRVANHAGVPLMVVLVEAELATRYDPAQVLSVAAGDPRRVGAGDTLAVPVAEVMGEFRPSASGVVVFLYEVRGEEGRYAGALPVTRDALAERGFEVSIESVWPR